MSIEVTVSAFETGDASVKLDRKTFPGPQSSSSPDDLHILVHLIHNFIRSSIGESKGFTDESDKERYWNYVSLQDIDSLITGTAREFVEWFETQKGFNTVKVVIKHV